MSCSILTGPTSSTLTIDPTPPPSSLDEVAGLMQSPDLIESEKSVTMLKVLNKLNLDALMAHRRSADKPTQFCSLCKKNGELPDFYMSHTLRDSFGHVICPVLSRLICEFCGATGIIAHTRSYCPVARRLRALRPQDPKLKWLCSNLAAINRSTFNKSRNTAKKDPRFKVSQPKISSLNQFYAL